MSATRNVPESVAITFNARKGKFKELSNFFVHKPPLLVGGKAYASVEHIYQTRKYEYEGASEYTRQYAELIRLARTPFMAKLLGTQKVVQSSYRWQIDLNAAINDSVKLGVRPNPAWESVKIEELSRALWIKFTQSERCRKELLVTGDARLTEEVSNDNVGEAGLRGNMLGDLLAESRTFLRNENERKRKRDTDADEEAEREIADAKRIKKE